LRTAAVAAPQLSQTHVVRFFVLVLIVFSPLVRGSPGTLGSGGVGKVSSELRLPTD
jgi:hypothetical protein